MAASIILSIPLVAVGIMATRFGADPAIECAAALAMSFSGIWFALIRLKVLWRANHSVAWRMLQSLAAALFLIGMTLAALYGLRAYVPIPAITIPFMRATHGTLNVIAITVMLFALTGRREYGRLPAA